MKGPHSAFSILCGLAVLAGCAGQAPWRSGPARLAMPERYEVVRDPLVLHSDVSLQDRAALVDDLLARREDLRAQLDLTLGGGPIEVYLFDGPAAIEQFMAQCFPSLPPRRAYFLDNDRQPTVYAQWGPKVDEDLRHELTHGYLHAVLPHLPLWLDEGLAEYYETPRGAAGFNPEHVQWLRSTAGRDGWRPDLPRLERLPASADMQEADYAEAWAWVHLLLHSRPEERQLLVRYLGELGRAKAQPLWPRLCQQWPDPNRALLAHLRPWMAGGPQMAVGSAKPPRRL